MFYLIEIVYQLTLGLTAGLRPTWPGQCFYSGFRLVNEYILYIGQTNDNSSYKKNHKVKKMNRSKYAFLSKEQKSFPDPYHLAGPGSASGNGDLDPGTKQIVINSHTNQPKL